MVVKRAKTKLLKNKVEDADQTLFGHEPNPEVVNSKTSQERANEIGLYSDSDTDSWEGKPEPIGLGRQFNKSQNT